MNRDDKIIHIALYEDILKPIYTDKPIAPIIYQVIKMGKLKQFAIYLDPDCPFSGSEIKTELNDFFQWLWDTTRSFEKYEKANPTKAKRVKEILAFFG